MGLQAQISGLRPGKLLRATLGLPLKPPPLKTQASGGNKVIPPVHIQARIPAFDFRTIAFDGFDTLSAD